MRSHQPIRFGDGIRPETRLYRYLSFSNFMALVETGQTPLANVNTWDDPWEVALAKLPTLQDDGQLVQPIWSFWQELYGQCWTLNNESDALWRIYSHHHEGVLIGTTADRFRLLKLEDKVKDALLGAVHYTDFSKLPSVGTDPLQLALLKRKAFEHEHEVRLLAIPHSPRSGELRLLPILVAFDPMEFIDEIVVDPRAPGWLVEAMIKYCKRVGFSIEPRQSQLYSADIFASLQLARRWVPKI